MPMREHFYGIHESARMLPIRERSPYFVESLYSGFRESHQYPLHDGPYYASFPPPSQFPEPLSRIPRSSSSIPTFGHYDESPFLDLPRGPPLRSSSAIPAYAYPGMTYRDVHPHGPPPNRPFRSTSSIPAYELHSHGRSSNRPTRSSSSIPAYNLEQPRSKKVAPEIELRVPMCCSKCEAKTKDVLRKLPGVTEVVTDRRSSKVTVSGKVDPQVVLKQIQKTKKKADFWTKQIYSQAFIDFIQSKTSSAQSEEEMTSSFHQQVPKDESEIYHAYEKSENLSSYEEYPGYYERECLDSCEQIERGPSHSAFNDEDYVEREREYNNYHTYGSRADILSNGRSSMHGHLEDFHGNRDDRAPHYESHGAPAYFKHFEPSSYGTPHPERASRSLYEDVGLSYRPSQVYGPSGVSNPSYMKRVISDY